MRRAELITGLVVAAIGAYALSLALNMALFGANSVPGPGFFPRLLSGLLLGLGLLLAVNSIRRRAKPADADADQDAERPPNQARRQLRAGSVWLCYALSAPLLTILGFVPATALLVFVLLFAIEGRRNWRSLVAAIVIPVATSALFVDVLTITLPTGLISNGPFGI
jgi:putative tricarboxylic transport membrane protein